MRSKINLQYFWSYVNYKISTINSGKASRDNLVSRAHLIKNLKLRPNTTNVPNGGYFGDVYDFRSMIFTEDLDWRILVGGTGNFNASFSPNKPLKKTITITNANGNFNFKVFGCYFGETWLLADGRKKGHAICGYICQDGSQFIYDSNNTRSIRMNWADDPLLVKNYMYRRYVEDTYIEKAKIISFDVLPVYGLVVSLNSNKLNLNNK
jgi:hypothetical protein